MIHHASIGECHVVLSGDVVAIVLIDHLDLDVHAPRCDLLARGGPGPR